ncbi:MAG TPA: hypothetical protein VLW48_02950 [Candidatus Bathyarchaeia archaeon]|nr:hypothetical protein [Candidatus Bathyarchaeia archaeon]
MKQRAIAGRYLRVWATVLGLLLGTGLAYAQTGGRAMTIAYRMAGIPQEQTSSASSMHGVFPVTLVKALDSKKLKEGDPVLGQLAGTVRLPSGVLVSSGTKVVGHVTQAQARSKGDPRSSLAMVFDKIEMSGKEVPIKGALAAIAPSLGDSGPANYAIGTSGNSGAGGAAPPMQTAKDLQAGSNVHPLLNSQSKGVLGFHDLQMGDDSVLTTKGKEVKLDSGTQMMIRVE